MRTYKRGRTTAELVSCRTRKNKGDERQTAEYTLRKVKGPGKDLVVVSGTELATWDWVESGAFMAHRKQNPERYTGRRWTGKK